MGSGFKSRGVHHWENSLRLAETQTGGCFVVPESRLIHRTGLTPKENGKAPHRTLQNYPERAITSCIKSANAPSPPASNRERSITFGVSRGNPPAQCPRQHRRRPRPERDGASREKVRNVMARPEKRCGTLWRVAQRSCRKKIKRDPSPVRAVITPGAGNAGGSGTAPTGSGTGFR
jgi:hypothetical protein